jgi:hypothetical protein
MAPQAFEIAQNGSEMAPAWVIGHAQRKLRQSALKPLE